MIYLKRCEYPEPRWSWSLWRYADIQDGWLHWGINLGPWTWDVSVRKWKK